MSVVRYTFSRCFRSQRWLVPVLVFILLIAVFYANGSAAFQTTGVIGALLLVPMGAWLVLAAVNSEDPGQAAVTSVSGRGVVRVRLFVLLAALIVCCGLTVVSVSASIVTDTAFSARQDKINVVGLLVGVHLIDAVLGIAIGAVVSKPVVERTGFAWLVVTLFFLLSLIIPAFPVRGTLGVLLGDLHNDPQLAIGAYGLGAAAIALVLGAIMAWTLRHRS